MLDFLRENWVPLLAVFGGGIAWLFDRKKRKAEVDRMKSENKATEAGALQSMQSVYDNFVKDVQTQITGLIKEVNDLRAENKELRGKVCLLEKNLSAAEKKLKESL